MALHSVVKFTFYILATFGGKKEKEITYFTEDGALLTVKCPSAI